MAITDNSLSKNKELVRRYTDEVFNQKRYHVIEETVADDLVSHNSALPEAITSAEEFEETVKSIHDAFPDLIARIDDIVAEGAMVVTRTTEGGTHEGAFAGIVATGHSFEVQAINLYRIEDNRIAENWVQFDTTGMLQQLGVA